MLRRSRSPRTPMRSSSSSSRSSSSRSSSARGLNRSDLFADELKEYIYAEHHDGYPSDYAMQPQHYWEEQIYERPSPTMFSRIKRCIDGVFEYIYQIKYINEILWILLIGLWIFIIWVTLSEDQ